MHSSSCAQVLEFGARRAQGVAGACAASKFAYLGGVDGTSLVTAGRRSAPPREGGGAGCIAKCTSF